MSAPRDADARALVLEAARTLVPRELPIPDVGDDDGVLRIEACGLCGTDHEQYTGTLPLPFAFVPGHEVVGVVEEVGPAAAARWGVAPGDRVAERFERGGHRFVVLDVLLLAGARPAMRVRHTAIYELRAPETAA